MINSYGAVFKWFFGIVEDRNDPEKLGRVRVRAHNFHTTDKVALPTDMLPWAVLINSPLSAGIKEVGLSPTGIMVGSTVFGFFADGEDAQVPMILGTIASIPDDHEVAQLARGINNVKKAPLYPEPDPKYAAKYPYNKVLTTESGHVIEIDDTPDNERIHIMHKSGTYIEIDNEGTRVDKTVGDHYSIMVGGENIRILGDAEIEVNGNADITLSQNAVITCYGDLSGKVFGEASLYIEKDAEIIGDGNITLRARQNISVYAAETLSLETLGNMTIRSGQLNIDTTNMVVTAATLSEIVTGTASRVVDGTSSIVAGGSASMTAGGSASITAGGAISLTGASISTIPPIDLTPD